MCEECSEGVCEISIDDCPEGACVQKGVQAKYARSRCARSSERDSRPFGEGEGLEARECSAEAEINLRARAHRVRQPLVGVSQLPHRPAKADEKQRVSKEQKLGDSAGCEGVSSVVADCLFCCLFVFLLLYVLFSCFIVSP